VLELVLRDLEPSDHVKIYTDAARDLLRQAREELEKGNFRQAAEKIWGAAALAVKAYAGWRKGRRLSSHG
jgi:HEPN domain-containing protein